MSKPNILCDTKGMSEERWQDCRKHGPNGDIPYTIGGSDISTIFGLSPWITPKEFWLIKKGRMQEPLKDNPLRLKLGHLMEPVIAEIYELKTGNIVEDDTNLYQHADFPYALANFDRRIQRISDKERGLLECKYVSRFVSEEWSEETCPLHYELQLRYYMGVDDCSFSDFGTMWGNNPEEDFMHPRLYRDKTMEDYIYEKCEQFIWSLRRNKEPTMQDINPKIALPSLSRIYGASKSELPELKLPKDFEETVREIARLQKEISGLRHQADKLELEADLKSVLVAEYMKAHERATLETTQDKLLIDFVTRRTTRPDSKVLKERYPEVYEAVKKTTESRKVKVTVEES